LNICIEVAAVLTALEPDRAEVNDGSTDGHLIGFGRETRP
jgi:hypothetical protein